MLTVYIIASLRCRSPKRMSSEILSLHERRKLNQEKLDALPYIDASDDANIQAEVNHLIAEGTKISQPCHILRFYVYKPYSGDTMASHPCGTKLVQMIAFNRTLTYIPMYSSLQRCSDPLRS